MADDVEDRYAAMVGVELAGELAQRELPVSGKVEELRARLREDDTRRAAEKDRADPKDAPEGEETEEAPIEVPEPREPVEYAPMVIVLNEQQARRLTASEAKLKQFTKHVAHMTPRKYRAGDVVTGIGDFANRVCQVLPFGIEVELTKEEPDDGLAQLRAMDAQISTSED